MNIEGVVYNIAYKEQEPSVSQTSLMTEGWRIVEDAESTWYSCALGEGGRVCGLRAQLSRSQEAHPLGAALLTWSPGDRPRQHRAFILRGTLQIQPTSLGAGATPTSSVAVDPQPETSYGKTRSTPLTTSLCRAWCTKSWRFMGIYPRQAWLVRLEISFLTPLLVKAEKASAAAAAAACLQGGNAVAGLGHDVLLSFPNTNNCCKYGLVEHIHTPRQQLDPCDLRLFSQAWIFRETWSGCCFRAEICEETHQTCSITSLDKTNMRACSCAQARTENRWRLQLWVSHADHPCLMSTDMYPYLRLQHPKLVPFT